jgi:hypothetical protein
MKKMCVWCKECEETVQEERISSEGSQYEDGAVHVMTEQWDESAFRRVQLKFLVVTSAILQEILDDGTPNEKYLKFHQAPHIFILFPTSVLTVPSHGKFPNTTPVLHFDAITISLYSRVDGPCQTRSHFNISLLLSFSALLLSSEVVSVVS